MQEDVSEPITRIITYGGSTRSALWNQTFADVHNTVVHASSNPETTALGAAMCAGAGAGLYPDVAAAARGMTPETSDFHPQRGNAEFYDTFYKKIYLGLYEPVAGKLAEARRMALDAPSL